jgi:hypothetical protein
VTLKYGELMKIEAMSYEDRVIKMFQTYPRNLNYLNELSRSIEFAKKGTKIYYTDSEVFYISAYVEKLGTFRKYWEQADFSNERIFVFSFTPEEEMQWSIERIDKEIRSRTCNKQDSDLICERALPFMLSYGKKRRLIPLLLRDFPDYVEYAMSFTPKEIRGAE